MRAGNAVSLAARNLVDSSTSGKTIQLSMDQGYKAVQENLGTKDANPVEKLLIEQVALSWLRLGLVEYALNGANTETSAALFGKTTERSSAPFSKSL